MRKIRLLIVDDSATVRLILTRQLESDPQLEVAATAANGRIALAKVEALAPDVMVLDVEMPEMDGLQTLTALRKTHPALPVIMFSRLTDRGARATVDALLLGANDYVLKPESSADVERAIRHELIGKIKLHARSSTDGDHGAAWGEQRADDDGPKPGSRDPSSLVKQSNAVLERPTLNVRGRKPAVIAIAVSTGGPHALATLLRQLPVDLPVPILIAQHMPPQFTSALAERLAATTRFVVREAGGDQPIDDARIWVAAGDHHMVVQLDRGAMRVRRNQDPPENSCRPSADVLFRSVAEVFGPAALAVVLTGMGHDGLAGARTIHEAGGQVLVQDEASSAVWGMPRAVAEAGLADQIVPLGQLGAEITRRLHVARVPTRPGE
jgi:two-component system chemotaxis response regulator CheB